MTYQLRKNYFDYPGYIRSIWKNRFRMLWIFRIIIGVNIIIFKLTFKIEYLFTCFQINTFLRTTVHWKSFPDFLQTLASQFWRIVNFERGNPYLYYYVNMISRSLWENDTIERYLWFSNVTQFYAFLIYNNTFKLRIDWFSFIEKLSQFDMVTFVLCLKVLILQHGPDSPIATIWVYLLKYIIIIMKQVSKQIFKEASWQE